MGGGGGLGSAIAGELSARGARVVVADVDDVAAKAVADGIVGRGGESLALQFDLSDLESFPERLERVREQFGSVDILVNMTGGPPPSKASGVAPDQWSEQFRSMVLGVIQFTDLALSDMRAKGWGRIITSTSSGVVAPIPNLGISNTLRASLVAWSKTLASEVAGDGITANVVIPGRIATQRIRQLDEARAKRENKTVEQVSKESTTSIPVGRYGEPAEYAAPVAFLASPAASYITGTIVRVDGGMIGSI
jgi:3-oxoacyl-[acyl-carrier protein] reductase